MDRILTIEQLKSLASTDQGVACHISLAGGLVRSSKHVWFNKNQFTVYNEIDGSEQKLTEKELMNKENTNVGYALQKGALYRDD